MKDSYSPHYKPKWNQVKTCCIIVGRGVSFRFRPTSAVCVVCSSDKWEQGLIETLGMIRLSSGNSLFSQQFENSVKFLKNVICSFNRCLASWLNQSDVWRPIWIHFILIQYLTSWLIAIILLYLENTRNFDKFIYLYHRYIWPKWILCVGYQQQ